MLLNEFLKEHRKVEEQGRKLQDQESAIAQQEAGNQISHRQPERAGIANPESHPPEAGRSN